MSTHWVIVIPRQPEFIPNEQAEQVALTSARTFFPEAAEIDINKTEELEFIDGGANTSEIYCPFCFQEIDFSWWTDTMQAAYEQHFASLLVKIPCCARDVSLNDLVYDWPVGFAYWSLSIRNPGVAVLTEAQETAFSKAISSSITIIYRRI